MQVNFRYSDTDFIAYLITMGYEYNKIEIDKDRDKHLKAYIYFEGEKDDLIQMQNDYKSGLVSANVLDFSNNRRKITKIIKAEILKYQVNNIS